MVENDQKDEERGGNQNNVEQANDVGQRNQGYWFDVQSIKMTKKQEMRVVNKDFYWLIPNLRAVNMKIVFRRNVQFSPLFDINSRWVGVLTGR